MILISTVFLTSLLGNLCVGANQILFQVRRNSTVGPNVIFAVLLSSVFFLSLS